MSTSSFEPADETIRQQAYYSWEADGRPDGRHMEHWERARVAQHATTVIGAGLALTPGNYEGGISAQPPVV